MTAHVTLRLTVPEAVALEAVVAGVGQLSGRQVDRESAAAAALDVCLTRLLEDFELPDPAVRHQVAAALEGLRSTWSRGNACL